MINKVVDKAHQSEVSIDDIDDDHKDISVVYDILPDVLLESTDKAAFDALVEAI